MSGRRAKAVRREVNLAVQAANIDDAKIIRAMNQRAKREFYRLRRAGVSCSVLFGG